MFVTLLKNAKVKGKSETVALLNPILVINVMHIVSAAIKAHSVEKRLTQSLSSEFTYYMSLSTNVTESLSRFSADGCDTKMAVDLESSSIDQV